MKRVITIILAGIIAITATAAPASAGTTDKGIVKAYCMREYHKPPKYVKAGSKAVLHRTGKKYIVVELSRPGAKANGERRKTVTE